MGVRAWSQVRHGRGRGGLYIGQVVSILVTRFVVVTEPSVTQPQRIVMWLVRPVVMPVVITLQHLMYYAELWHNSGRGYIRACWIWVTAACVSLFVIGQKSIC